MKIKWIEVVIIILFVLLMGLLLLVASCASSVKWQSDPNEPVYTLTGKAAEKVAEAIAMNALTVEGRASQVMKYNPWLYAGLVIMLVGGLAFWGFTRSRYGFIIPGSAIAGVIFITFWAEYSQWITLAVLLIAMAVLVWKAVQYQKERNAKGGE